MKHEPKIGEIYHVTDFPGLHGNPAKSRYCIVVHPSERLKRDGVLVVSTSSSSLSKYKVPLPNRRDNPGCATGLPRPCDAVCDEVRLMPAELLIDRVGVLSKVLTDRVMERTRAYLASKLSDDQARRP